jgi:alpha-glucosidase
MKQQPDLNWHNPEVKQAMWDASASGSTSAWTVSASMPSAPSYEDPNLTPHNVPMNLAELRRFSELAQTQRKETRDKYWHDMFKNQWGQPGIHELMKELRAILDEYDGDRMLVGEDDNIDYMGNGKDELHLVFNFPLMRTETHQPGSYPQEPKGAAWAVGCAKKSQRGWPATRFGNHDCSRIYTRFGINCMTPNWHACTPRSY